MLCVGVYYLLQSKKARFTMFMSRKFGSRSNRLAGYKGYLLGWNQLGNNKMSLQTDPRQINLKLFIQYQNTMLNLQLYRSFSYVIMYNNYVIRRLHIIKLQLIINHRKYISKLATDWLRCIIFFICHILCWVEAPTTTLKLSQFFKQDPIKGWKKQSLHSSLVAHPSRAYTSIQVAWSD